MNSTVDRELDEKIAIQVFGWKRKGTKLIPTEDSGMSNWDFTLDRYGRPHWLPYYSSNLNHAWDVMIRLWEFNDDYEIWYDYNDQGEKGYTILLYNQDDMEWSQVFDTEICRAICKAALNMVWWENQYREAKENGTYIRPGWSPIGDSPYE